jgi:hypothetical protein
LRQKRDFKASERNSRKPTVPSHNVCYVKSLIRLRNPMLAQHSGKKLLYRVMRAGFAAQP